MTGSGYGRYVLLAGVRRARKGAAYERHLIMVGNGPFSYCLCHISQVDRFDLSIDWVRPVYFWSGGSETSSASARRATTLMVTAAPGESFRLLGV